MEAGVTKHVWCIDINYLGWYHNYISVFIINLNEVTHEF